MSCNFCCSHVHVRFARHRRLGRVSILRSVFYGVDELMVHEGTAGMCCCGLERAHNVTDLGRVSTRPNLGLPMFI